MTAPKTEPSAVDSVR